MGREGIALCCSLQYDSRERRSGVPALLGPEWEMVGNAEFDYSWPGTVVERKTVDDLCNSMLTRRGEIKVVRQLQHARATGAQAWLVVEGFIPQDGAIPGRRWSVASVRGFLFRMRVRGVQVEYTAGTHATAAFLDALHKKTHEASKVWPLEEGAV